MTRQTVKFTVSQSDHGQYKGKVMDNYEAVKLIEVLSHIAVSLRAISNAVETEIREDVEDVDEDEDEEEDDVSPSSHFGGGTI
jgi:hypothetical protein